MRTASRPPAGFSLRGLAAEREALAAIFRESVPPLDGTPMILVLSEGQYQLIYRDGAGVHEKFVTPEAVAAAFTGQPRDSGWLPPHILRCGAGGAGPFVVAWIPPGRHLVPLTPPGDGPVQWITVPLPGLVLAGANSAYSLWAVTTPTFDPAAPAFYPPVPNIFDSGGICWGANTPPPATPQNVPAVWELYRTAPFNKNAGANRSQAEPADVRRQLLALAAAEAAVYPPADLVPVRTGADRQPAVGACAEKAISL